MRNIDCVVIGAGAVGLSIARHLALAGREVVILEARLCVQGREAMYAYCAERGIGHKPVGKLIVATTEEDIPDLSKYVEQGNADGALQPGYTGIRPRLAGPNDPPHSGAADFVIQTEAVHGVRGLVNLFGIESPGLTSSIALGRHVASALGDRR